MPADIATLPNLQGFGNVVSLHEAMALDTTGALKDLVIAYTQETEIIARKELMKDIIFIGLAYTMLTQKVVLLVVITEEII